MFYHWSRNKHVAIENLDGHLRITTSVRETFFSASVVLLLRLSDLTIVSIQSEMPRPINEECLGALSLLEKVAGERVSEGLTKRIDHSIGGPNGCTHMANLVLESCHAAAIGFRQVQMARAISSGASKDDYYREFMATRPKELLNSCVTFKENSPVVRRITTPSEDRQSLRSAVRHITGEGLPVVGFGRNKLIGVGRLDNGNFLSRAVLEDNAHSMRVNVEMNPDLTIVAVEGKLVRVPNEECSTAIDALQQAVGLGLRPGLTAAVDERVGRNGCPHMANLLLEACHGVVQGTLGAAIVDCRNSDQVLTWDSVRARWLGSTPLMHDSCLAYRVGGPLWQRIGLPVPVPSR